MKKEVFIERAVAVHGDKFDYSLLPDEFETQGNIPIVCKLHGIFSQKASNHVHLKQLCPICGDIKALENKRVKSAKVFIEKATEHYNGKFDYSLVEYKNGTTPVKIICPTHGVFEQMPQSHIKGVCACPECRNTHLREKFQYSFRDFQEKAVLVHGYKYTYPEFIPSNMNTPVEIICPVHGVFLQKPSGHLLGGGCPACASYGYKKNKTGYFYILKITDDVIKFGITNKVKTRLYHINFLSSFDVKIIRVFKFLDGGIPQLIEKTIKERPDIVTSVVSKADLPSGYTETTYLCNLPKIIEIVEKYMPVE